MTFLVEFWMNVETTSVICLPSMLSSHDKNHVRTENVSASCLKGATLIYYNRTCGKSSLSAVPPRWNLCHLTPTSTTRFLKKRTVPSGAEHHKRFPKTKDTTSWPTCLCFHYALRQRSKYVLPT